MMSSTKTDRIVRVYLHDARSVIIRGGKIDERRVDNRFDQDLRNGNKGYTSSYKVVHEKVGTNSLVE